MLSRIAANRRSLDGYRVGLSCGMARRFALPWANLGDRWTCETLYLQFLSHFASSTMPRMVMYVGSDTFRRGS